MLLFPQTQDSFSHSILLDENWVVYYNIFIICTIQVCFHICYIHLVKQMLLQTLTNTNFSHYRLVKPFFHMKRRQPGGCKAHKILDKSRIEYGPAIQSNPITKKIVFSLHRGARVETEEGRKESRKVACAWPLRKNPAEHLARIGQNRPRFAPSSVQSQWVPCLPHLPRRSSPPWESLLCKKARVLISCSRPAGLLFEIMRCRAEGVALAPPSCPKNSACSQRAKL